MEKVLIYKEMMTIPTYSIGAEEKNPVFIEKRVYQGSTGKVYPNPIIEKISDEKIDKEYEMIVLENKYIKVLVMPELGGRIYTAYDKSNNYDFVYHNEVIKPALVGLLGPWISGGIEFNWPQHHRPSTFMGVSYKIIENYDGSASVFVGEIENMFGTKGMAEIKLYPDKAFIEINAQIYNRTDLPQTFLWWANPAVKVNDFTKTIMPPDVTAVMDHGKRAVSTFPIATGEYYKMDYSSGVDISMYKNIPVPTSFMAYKSNFDFVGGYDFSIDAGIYHFADHHVSPGKKQWTWGCGDFGKAWDRNLTDKNGPYVELMTGCFTDNQPDFTFLAPHEEKSFTQYFMPYKHVGEIKNANKDFCFNIKNGEIIIYSTGEFKEVEIIVSEMGKVIYKDVQNFNPNTKYLKKLNCGDNVDIEIIYGEEKLSFNPSMVEKFEIPNPANACPPPSECKSLEELYLNGLHIEQYRHATRSAEEYYLEGLKRDNSDIRLNNAYGLLLLRRGDESSIKYFKKAIEKLTSKNPNPYDTEPFYNLGLAYLYTGQDALAYDNFYKAIWSNFNKSASFYFLAVIDTKAKNYKKAIDHINNSLIFNSHNMKAYALKGLILQALNNIENAKINYHEAQKIDALDVISDFELALFAGKSMGLQLRDTEIIDLTYDYLLCGAYDRAILLIDSYFAIKNDTYPLLWYYRAYAQIKSGKSCTASLKNAIKNANSLCFAHRISDIIVLKEVLENTPNDFLANYYLGNIYYDKKRYDLAAKYWHEAESLNNNFPTVKRNLALYYYNKEHNVTQALIFLEKAFDLNKSDTRILMELDQLYKVVDRNDRFRFDFLSKNIGIVEQRDDVYLEYLTLLNKFGDKFIVEKLLSERNFHPWEGGEGKTSKLYKMNKLDIADIYIGLGDFEAAILKILQALERPYNLGEGKLFTDTDCDVYYHLGNAYSKKGDRINAIKYFNLAILGQNKISNGMYYNDLPIEYQYYVALSLKELGKNKEADKIASAFNQYAKENMNKKMIIDYFAVSLPDLLVWEQDLDKNNNKFCERLQELAKEIIQ